MFALACQSMLLIEVYVLEIKTLPFDLMNKE